ncbi:hypothetical protein MTR67_015288 [Solanum verrucosum]|uniref:Uncharacterized protein n=1 Tax=Solanum verrucosum TaxID=315347 RepID=A0AAF0QG34_SOLVR|nr:hypothetical protein MTR67_015288 [Solanum verrucosum]
MVIWHRDSLNQIRNAMTILSSYKIKAGTASVSDAISTNYSDFTANCTSIQVQIHKSLIPCSRSCAILLSCYNSMTLKPMYNTISDAESVNLEIGMG